MLVKTNCKRCGCDLLTAERSITGADETKARLGSLCSGCTTPEEQQAMLAAQGDAIQRRLNEEK